MALDYPRIRRLGERGPEKASLAFHDHGASLVRADSKSASFSHELLAVRWAVVYAATECIAVVVASLAFATTWQWVVSCALIEERCWVLARDGCFTASTARSSCAGRWRQRRVLAGRFIEYQADISRSYGNARHVARGPNSRGVVLGAVVGASPIVSGDALTAP